LEDDPEVEPELDDDPEVEAELEDDPEVEPELEDDPEVEPELEDDPEVEPELDDPEFEPELDDDPEVVNVVNIDVGTALKMSITFEVELHRFVLIKQLPAPAGCHNPPANIIRFAIELPVRKPLATLIFAVVQAKVEASKTSTAEV